MIAIEQVLAELSKARQDIRELHAKVDRLLGAEPEATPLAAKDDSPDPVQVKVTETGTATETIIPASGVPQ